MIVLQLLRFFLPPFHPWKYWWITYWYGEQSKAGGWKDKEQKRKVKW